MNLEKAKNEFNKYVQKYDFNIDSIKRKYYHTYRVAEISKLIAENLNFDQDEIELAILIGLLHDIARFEQWMRYGTFNDLESIDHGDLGIEILQENNFIRNFIEEDKYDEIIFASIKNHNKLNIEKGLDEYTLKFCKVIRDADKIDILYLGTTEFYKTENVKIEIQESAISEECYKQILNKELIKRKNVKYSCDTLLNKISFIYDLNFDYSKKYVYNKNYINIILDLFDFSKNPELDKINTIRKDVNKYLAEY